MKIVIRVDSSVQIGSGHTMRCLVLARELRANCHNVQFVVRDLDGNAIDLIEKQGFNVCVLPKSSNKILPKSDDDYLAWLQESVEVDAKQFINIAQNPDIVVVDHYALDYDWESRVKGKFGCKIVVLDDLVREHCADLIIDQTIMRSSSEYRLKLNKPSNQSSQILTGCDYALLNSLFAARREEAQDLKETLDNHKILVFMGGGDRGNTTLQILRTFESQSYTKYKVTVLLAPQSPSYTSVSEFCTDKSSWLTHIDFVEDMAQLMLEHSLMIGAPGTTSWERACLGIPSVIIPLAENQLTIAKALAKTKAALRLEQEHLDRDLVPACKEIIDSWADFREANIKICDGLGVRRVTRVINGLTNDSDKGLSIRKASPEDIGKVYEWQCHENTRKYALSPKVPSWEEHFEWMSNKLKSTTDFFYIIESQTLGCSVAVVRLDRRARAEYTLSIYASPDHYGKGIAKKALQIIGDIHRDVTLYATVLEENAASQKLFTSANYQRVSPDSFTRLPFEVRC